jgi:hypothetical protein
MKEMDRKRMSNRLNTYARQFERQKIRPQRGAPRQFRSIHRGSRVAEMVLLHLDASRVGG